MTSADIVFVGIRGSVVALDCGTGSILWRADLKGADFVNVLIHESDVLATTKGEIYCLDAGTGQEKWHNPLKGLGIGLVSIAIAGNQSSVVLSAQKRKKDQEAAAAAAASY